MVLTTVRIKAEHILSGVVADGRGVQCAGFSLQTNSEGCSDTENQQINLEETKLNKSDYTKNGEVKWNEKISQSGEWKKRKQQRIA